MILSASRKTDIVYFYYEWFLDKLNKNKIAMFNPYNKQTYEYNLTPKNVECIIFWTKDSSNFEKVLNKLDEDKYNYYFQHTLNNYPDIFEKGVKPVEKRIESFKNLSEKIGKDRVIWRYDPIIISNITDVNYHKENFEMLIENLKNHTSRVVISYVDIYAKLINIFDTLKKEKNIIIEDILKNEEQLKDLTFFIKNLADKNNIEIESCAEKSLDKFGIKNTSCIDGNLISKLFNLDIKHFKDPNQRTECGCMKSTDIGVYNSCLFNCLYCYANSSNESERMKIYKQQDINNLFLK